jgi:hypothetical protein
MEERERLKDDEILGNKNTIKRNKKLRNKV